MNHYLRVCGVIGDEQRIAVASAYLKEAAFNWWESICKQPNPPTQDWQAFADALRERFQPLAASRTARVQLRQLRQGTMSVLEFGDKFYSLVQQINDMSEPDQVDTFLFGLRSSIAREVNLQTPQTLLEAMNLAQRVEALLHNNRIYSNYSHEPRSTHYTNTSSHSTSSVPTSSSSSGAMELGNMNLENFSNNSGTNYSQESETEQECEYNRYLQEGENYEPDFNIWKGTEQEEVQGEAVEQLQAMQGRGGKAPFMPQEEFTRQ
jgi:hypothetical protein